VVIETLGPQRGVVHGAIDTFPWERIDSAEIGVLRSRLQSARGSEHLKPLGAASVNKHVAAIKGVMRHCFLHGLITAETHHRILSVKRVKGSRILRGRNVSIDERKALVDGCNVATFRGARDAAIVSILYACGLRRDEVSRLDVGDYDPGTGTMRVLGKGNKERQVDIVGGAAVAMNHWLRIRGNTPGPMFIAMTWGKHSRLRKDGRRVTGGAIHQILEALATAAKLPPMSPHDFRRTCIGDLLDAGVDLVTVQKIVGHNNSDTTARYDRRHAAVRRKASMLLEVPFPEVDS
jgi:site-specific recombinase XerC